MYLVSLIFVAHLPLVCQRSLRMPPWMPWYRFPEHSPRFSAQVPKHLGFQGLHADNSYPNVQQIYDNLFRDITDFSHNLVVLQKSISCVACIRVPCTSYTNLIDLKISKNIFINFSLYIFDFPCNFKFKLLSLKFK